MKVDSGFGVVMGQTVPIAEQSDASPIGPHPSRISSLLRVRLYAAGFALLRPTSCQFPAQCRVPWPLPQNPTTVSYLEIRRVKEASKNPQTPSSGRRRCPRSCSETQRLCPGPRSVETRGTNGPRAPPSPLLNSKCCLRRGIRRGIRLSPAELEGSEVVPSKTVTPERPPLSTPTRPETLLDPESRLRKVLAPRQAYEESQQ